MNRLQRWSGVVLLLGVGSTPAAGEVIEPHRDERSIERFAWECRSEIGRREVTLFANGTVRFRSGPWEAMSMSLGDLTPDELTSVLRQLDLIRRSPSFPETDSAAIRPWSGDLAGPRLERCRIHLELPAQPPIDLEFTPLDATPHAFARLKIVADDLALATRDLDSPERLPTGYQPRPDDVLRTESGLLYRVIGLTSDGRGVEMERLDQPFRVFHAVEALPDLFIAVEGNGIDPFIDEPWIDDLEVRDPVVDSGGGDAR